MSVWEVAFIQSYEADFVVAVFDTEQAARALVNEIMRKRRLKRPPTDVEVREVVVYTKFTDVPSDERNW